MSLKKLDGVLDNASFAEREVDIEIDMDIAGIVLCDMLEDGDGGYVVFCKFRWAL